MRTTPLAAVLLFGTTMIAQAQTAPDQNLESRYVRACLKEDTEAYCRCEFRVLSQRIKGPRDLEFLTQLEEQTAGLPNTGTDEIVMKLPQDRLRLIISLGREVQSVVQRCPGYRNR